MEVERDTKFKLKALEEHNRAFITMGEKIRDPFILAAPDGNYYMTGTTAGTSWGDRVGVQIYKSSDLCEWEDLGYVWDLYRDGREGWYFNRPPKEANANQMNPYAVWAPEVHYFNDTWWLTVSRNGGGNGLLKSTSGDIMGPYEEILHLDTGIDSHLYKDGETVYYTYGYHQIAAMTPSMDGLKDKKFTTLEVPGKHPMGYEGILMLKYAEKYLWIASGRYGYEPTSTYDLYYSVSDKLDGKYSERRMAVKNAGHGNIIQDKKGNWWVTAFDNEFATNWNCWLVPINLIDKGDDVEIEVLDERYRPTPEDQAVVRELAVTGPNPEWEGNAKWWRKPIPDVEHNWQEAEGSGEKQRLIVLADMGNEYDEQQQIMHMLLYANEFDLEGLVAVTGKFLNPSSSNPAKQRLYPELFHSIIDGYAEAYPSLVEHCAEYPTADYLRSIVATGQKGYGSDAVGKGLSSEGSELLIKSFESEDPRPLYIVVNAGSNTLAQALYDYEKSHSKRELQALIARLRVFENGAQDDAGAYICNRYPSIHWVRSNYQAYCYAGPGGDGATDNKGSHNNLGPYTWEPYAYSGVGQHQWALEHICAGNGPYGTHWPLRQFPKGGLSFMEGGGTVPWLPLINKGLSDINNPSWGGWGGRYSADKSADYWSKHQSVRVDEKRYSPFMMYTEESDRWFDPETGELYEGQLTPVWRWRRAFMNDFKYRMDWCHLTPDKARHNPVAVVDDNKSDAILTLEVKAGEVLELDASASYDVDGDKLSYTWSYYAEAGSYPHYLPIDYSSKSKAVVIIPSDAVGTEMHIILEVRDNVDYKVAMFDYRRLILKCK